MLPPMKASLTRRAACLLLLGALLAGCGKSGTRLVSSEGELNPVTPVSRHGAAGQITRNTTRLGGADSVTNAAAVSSATHPGLVPAARPQAAVMVSRYELPLALAASVLAGTSLHAALLYSEPTSVPAASVQALEAMRPIGSPSLAGAQVLQIGSAAVPRGYAVRSLPASEVFTGAAEIERLAESLEGATPHLVLVVNAETAPAFAMPAAGLAAQSGAPIMLVTSTGIPPATRTALAALGHPAIDAIGPPSVISAAVFAELERFGTVKRIAGATPAENAVAVAREGWGIHEAGHGFVFASAAEPLDAPAAAPLSATGDYAPLLLLESASLIPPPLGHYLEDIQAAYSPTVSPVRAIYNRGWIIGGEHAVSATTQAELDVALEVAPRSSAPTPSLSP